MRAVTFQGPGEPMTVEERPEPPLPADGVIVETAACGVCRSDWHAWQGDWSWLGLEMSSGLVFGHEPCGRVVEVGGEVDSVREGELVTNPFTLAGGDCRFCRRGEQNRCERALPMGFLDAAPGAFAERYPVRAADTNVVALPDGVDPVDAAGLGCRFATAFHGLVTRIDLGPGEWVAIHGCGGVGLSAVHVADALGANVVAVDVKPAALERARELGADETVDAEAVADPARAVAALVPGRGADVSVDALGIAETCRNAVNSLGAGGRHLQIGLTTAEEAGEIPLPIDVIVNDERSVVGSYGAPPHEYERMFRMIEAGRLDPGAVVSETLPLSAVPDTVAAMDEYGTVGIPVCTSF